MGSLEQGASNAVSVCMGLKPGERVLIVTDRAQKEVGEALRREAERITSSNVMFFVLEDISKRPLSSLPKSIEDSIRVANVTFWAAESKPGELSSRQSFINLAKKHARHGHMPNISKKLMEQGMCVDYNKVYELTHRIYEIVRHSSEIVVSDKLGTNLRINFDKSWRWVPSDGRYHEKGRWGNLPEGEVFTAPKEVNGHLVTSLLGDWFSEKYGNLRSPISLDIKDSRIDLNSIGCGDTTLRSEVLEYLSTDENSNRASEFALPTNPVLMSSPTIGNLLQDEKARVHIAFGDPYPDETGATWKSTTHVDMLLEGTDLSVDGKEIMHKGSYVTM